MSSHFFLFLDPLIYPELIELESLNLVCWQAFAGTMATYNTYRLAVWLSGNTLASINVVALRQTRLVLGWVTVCGRVNHLGM